MEEMISKIDSDRFGFIVAKLPQNISNVKEVLDSLRTQSARLVIARVPLTSISVINELEQEGFRYKDAQLTYNYDLDKKIPSNSYGELRVVDYTSEHYEQILSITENSFDNYGHYFADDKLDKSKCKLIYKDWIHRCCTDKQVSDFILVAEYDGKVAGYLTLKIKEENNGRFGSCFLGAVSPLFRGKGVFTAINIESLSRAKKMGLRRVETNVLTTNFAVIRTYSNLTYYVINSTITMHCWL